jgi:hypothetical protein
MAVCAPLLTTLPPEILLLISEHLAALELVRLSRTCRTLRHFGGCKSVAKAFTRNGTADSAIRTHEDTVTRMDLVVELFRHVKDRKSSYPDVATIAARLNDLKQLEAWRAEFGFVPHSALYGATRSDRIETFDFVLSRVKLGFFSAEMMLGIIGEKGDRALLEHLQTNYPELVTPYYLKKVVESSARKGLLDFALDVLEEMSPRCGKVIHDCAGHIAVGAALHGNSALFVEFIEKFQYCDSIRDRIATYAARKNRVDFMCVQEETDNAASSFDLALDYAVENNAIDAVEYILGNDDFVTDRLSGLDLVDPLWTAIRDERTEMLPLILARVPRILLLREAASTDSLDEAKTILGGYRLSEQVRANADQTQIEFDAYSDDIPDWQMTVWLIIIGLESNARIEKSDIDDAERAHFLRVLPAAIYLAGALSLGESLIDEMTRFANGTL